MLATVASSSSIKTVLELLLLSIITAQDWLMADWNKAWASQKFHVIEEILNDPMCHRKYILILGLSSQHAVQNGLKNIFIGSLFYFKIVFTTTQNPQTLSVYRIPLTLENRIPLDLTIPQHF